MWHEGRAGVAQSLGIPQRATVMHIIVEILVMYLYCDLARLLYPSLMLNVLCDEERKATLRNILLKGGLSDRRIVSSPEPSKHPIPPSVKMQGPVPNGLAVYLDSYWVSGPPSSWPSLSGAAMMA